jgi:predicted 3-demethylubiquinone-9 3-methyltransferase (glyoxalase superfamily)
METKKMPKNAKFFHCIKCDFKCSKQSNFNKHCLTAKHKMETFGNRMETQKMPHSLRCDCGKMFSSKSGLWKHKKKCKNAENVLSSHFICDSSPPTSNMEMMFEKMCQQNMDLQSAMIEKQEKYNKKLQEEREEHKKEIQNLTDKISKISTITNNNTTTNNNKFNLNFFLNTQCKDAMSIQSFMENLQIGCKELEHMGDVGYLNGMIDIFNNTIGNMDVYKRPLHCTDLKREVLYFKQGADWERDSEDKQHLKKLIKNVETKNYYNLQEWQKDHPDSRECDTPDSEHYMKIATEALGGADSNKDSMYLSKIMKHIVKEVHVKP